jgi:A/G-specific adenine glycosylase
MEKKQDKKRANGPVLGEILLAWFASTARSLPWRTHRSLYGTVVSEFMLQRTRVETVLPYYERWMARFPSFQAVAEANDDEILLIWSGLGYYARARHLHGLCRELASPNPIPQNPDHWQKFYGVGSYTAAAIAAQGQGFDAIALDGNGLRVLSRIYAVGGPFPSADAAGRALQDFASELKIPSRCGALTEALMDLAAAHCLPRVPRCAGCPLASHCRVFLDGLPAENFPKFQPKKYGREVRHRLWLVENGQLWLHRGRGLRLKNLHELPTAPSEVDVQFLPVLGTIRRRIGQTDYVEYVHDGGGLAAHFRSCLAGEGDEIRPVPIGQLANVPISGPHRRCIDQIIAAEDHRCGTDPQSSE